MQGLLCFPCLPDKRPACAHGFKAASTDHTTLRELFASAGNATLVGVPTGQASGFSVLDLDYRHGAGDWTHIPKLPMTRTHITRSNGRHLLFKYADGVRNSAGKLGPGVDVRGEGGYVIFPPSPGYKVHADIPIVPWPDWLKEAILSSIVATPPAAARQRVPGSPPSSGDWRAMGELAEFMDLQVCKLRKAKDGTKRDTLRRFCMVLGGVAEQAGFTDEEIKERLRMILKLKAVRDWAVAEETMRWGLAWGRARPVEIKAPGPGLAELMGSEENAPERVGEPAKRAQPL